MVGIASMDGLLNALTKAIYSDHMRSYGLGISLVLGPRPAHAIGQHLLHVHHPAGVLLLMVPSRHACMHLNLHAGQPWQLVLNHKAAMPSRFGVSSCAGGCANLL